LVSLRFLNAKVDNYFCQILNLVQMLKHNAVVIGA